MSKEAITPISSHLAEIGTSGSELVLKLVYSIRRARPPLSWRKNPFIFELKKVSFQKWPTLVIGVFWTKRYQLLDVLRNALRIIVEERHFQLQQAVHAICSLPQNCTKSVCFALKKSLYDHFPSEYVISMQLLVISGSVRDRYS